MAHLRGWQELKEALAHAISVSTRCSFSARLRLLHARVISFGLHYNLHLCSLLVGGYSSFDDIGAACQVFDSIYPPPTKTLLWNVLIRGCLHCRRADLALSTFKEMLKRSKSCVPDRNTFNLTLKACIDTRDFEFGCYIADIIRTRGLELDLFVGTSLIDMYSRAVFVDAARELFDKMPVRDVVCWNAMISGYVHEDSLTDAIFLFKAMKNQSEVVPSQATMVALVSVCASVGSFNHGQVFHAHAIRMGFENDQFVCNTLIEMYIVCGHLCSSCLLFDGLKVKDQVSWSTMIGGYVHHQCPKDALQSFSFMLSTTQLPPTRSILFNVFLACADMGDWQQGKKIEEEFLRDDASSVELDIHLITTLVYMYAKCGRFDISYKLLNENMEARNDVVAWNALLSGCSGIRDVYRASYFLVEMQRSGIAPDGVTILTLLMLFASTSLLRMGMMVHAIAFRRGFMREKYISNSLIAMYSQCGSIEDSRAIFDDIIDKDVVTWSIMLKGYAENKHVDETLEFFQLMRIKETPPNHITFISALSACSHGGYVEKGHQLFRCMIDDYGLHPSLEHYGCLVNLLSRAGLLSEALDFVKSDAMEVSDATALWGSLLSACTEHENVSIGEEVATNLFRLEPRNAANYLALANIYKSTGRRKDTNNVLWLMRNNVVKKRPSFSWFDYG